MKTSAFFAGSLACLFLAPALGAASPGLVVGVATIVNSGSTNSPGFSVKVNPNGHATLAMAHQASKSMTTTRTMAQKLFADIHAAQSSSRPSGAAMCMKSASFGSTMRVKYGSWTSVDLNCPVVGANATLKADVEKILVALHVQPTLGRPISLPGHEPRRMEETPRSAATPMPTSTP